MECVDIIHRWTVNKKPDKCSCWVVDNPQKPYILFLDMVNEVIIRFKGKSPAHLFEVVHHMNDQPWRIANKYLYFNQTTSSLTIPIITDALCTLAIDDPICHVRPVNPMITLQNIKGKRIFYNQNPHFTSFFLSTDIYIFSSLRSRTK